MASSTGLGHGCRLAAKPSPGAAMLVIARAGHPEHS